VTVTQWGRHCNLIRYAGYGYKQPAATAPTAAWLMRQHQVASGSPDTQLHVKFLTSSPLAFFSDHLSERDFPLLVCHSKKIDAMFRSTYCCEQLFSKDENRQISLGLPGTAVRRASQPNSSLVCHTSLCCVLRRASITLSHWVTVTGIHAFLK